MELKSSVLERPAHFVGVSVPRYTGISCRWHGSFFRTKSKRDETAFIAFFFASSECMSIHTYTFYTLHVSNAYFPKIYVMCEAHTFTIIKSHGRLLNSFSPYRPCHAFLWSLDRGSVIPPVQTRVLYFKTLQERVAARRFRGNDWRRCAYTISFV